MPDLAALLEFAQRERRWTRQLVSAVPEGHFDWVPREGEMSAGGIVRHLVQAEIFWRKLLVALSRGEVFDPYGLGDDGVANLTMARPAILAGTLDARWGVSFADCLSRWSAIESETAKAFAGLDEAALDRQGRHPVTGATLTVRQLYLMMVSHEVHHRGQLSAYLKMLGVEQPVLYV